MPYMNYFIQLKQAIPLLMEESDIPGFSMSICDEEKVIFSNTYGYTDLTKNIPITRATQFSLQSISKTYTAFGFMLAVQDGKVSLDDSVKKYLTSFSVRHKDGEDYSSSITFRQCLSHRSGLKHEAPIGSNYVYSGTFDEHIRSINGTFLRFKPGEQYYYSNLGIDLVAYVLGRIYEMPFDEYMSKKVFIPLEMPNSTYRQEDYLIGVESAVGHNKESLVKYPIMMIGAGGMYSCPDDMTCFIRCFLNQGNHSGQRIIKQEFLEQMYNEYSHDSDLNTTTINKRTGEWPYILGLAVGTVNNRTIINHNGGGFGFLATQDIAIDSGLGAAALINSTEHPNTQLTIIRNMWDDLFTLQDAGRNDCEPIHDSYEPLIGLYEAKFIGGSWKLAVIPRNGAIYCNNQKVEHHTGNLFFNAKNDCIEFMENGMKYDNIFLHKIR